MSHGVYLLSPDVNNLSQLSVVVMPGTANRVGGIMQGVGTSIASTGVMTLAPATANAIGGIKIGANLTVTSDGTISAPAPIPGPPGPQGEPGGSTNLISYQFASQTTTPPSKTEVRLNNADQTAATLVWVDHQTLPGNDATVALNGIVAGDGIYLQDQDESNKQQTYTASGPAVDRGTYTEIPVSWQKGGAPLTGGGGGQSGIFLGIIRLGPPGPQGPPGPVIPATATVLGGVKIGANVSVTTDGTISVAAPTPAQISSDWLASSGAAQILNKPPLAYSGGVSTITGPLAATGVITANAGSQIYAGQAGAYLDTGNAFQLWRAVNSGNNILVQYQPSAGAGWSNQAIYYIGTSKGLVSFPDPAGVSVTGPVSTGNLTVNGTQIWGGQVNANGQALVNLGGANTSGRISWIGNSSDLVMYNTGQTKYLQVIPADGSQGANPYIFSSTGLLVTNAGLNLPYANFTNPGAMVFGSNWQSWTPTLTANAGTLTPTAWYYAGYIRVGPIVFFSIRFAFNASAAFNYLYVTMPVTGYTPSNNYMGVGNCFCESGPLNLENLLMRWELSDHVVVQRAGGAGYALGNSYLICMNGFYRIA